MEEKNRKINKRLIQVMVDRDISTLELAQKIGVCPSLMSLIRQGWRQPTEQQARKIEEVLDMPGLFQSRI